MNEDECKECGEIECDCVTDDDIRSALMMLLGRPDLLKKEVERRKANA